MNTSVLPPLPFTPSYALNAAFSNTFEDPFSYQSADFSSILEDPIPHPHPSHSTGMDHPTNASDLDNKLLGFGAPILKAPVLDDNGQTWPSMTAELYGMFFVAEDVFGDNNMGAGRPMELTCYRRNLFQISGNIVMSRGIKSMINEQVRHKYRTRVSNIFWLIGSKFHTTTHSNIISGPASTSIRLDSDNKCS